MCLDDVVANVWVKLQQVLGEVAEKSVISNVGVNLQQTLR